MNKIAIIISDITKSAGTERAVVNLANSLISQENNEISILSVYSMSGTKPFYEIDDRVNIIHLNENLTASKISRISSYYSLRKELKRIADEKHINIVIGTIHAFNIVLATMNGFVRIGCEHLNYNSCPQIIRPIRRLMYRRLDSVVLLTKQDADHYRFIKNKISIIPNISSFERNKKAELKNHVILSVGRLTRQKGYDMLIDVVSAIKHEMGNWIIEIYGTGEDKDNLERKIKEKELEEIISIYPPVDNIRDKMLSSAFYLMTSRNEGLPMVLIEAQTCGLPIVSFDCPEGPSEIINDDEDGFLIPTYDYELMRNRIIELINNDSLRNKLGDSAYEQSLRFSKETIIEKWNSLFDQISLRRRNDYTK